MLIIIVLMQASKGGGLSGSIAGGAGGQMGSMFGTRRTADFLSKSTWWLGGALAVMAIVINLFFLPGAMTSDQRESIIQSGGQQNVPTQPTLPENLPIESSGDESAPADNNGDNAE